MKTAIGDQDMQMGMESLCGKSPNVCMAITAPGTTPFPLALVAYKSFNDSHPHRLNSESNLRSYMKNPAVQIPEYDLHNVGAVKPVVSLKTLFIDLLENLNAILNTLIIYGVSYISKFINSFFGHDFQIQ